MILRRCNRCNTVYDTSHKHICSKGVYGRTRSEFDSIYSSSKWRAVRQYMLSIQPICQRCHTLTDTLEVHHIYKSTTHKDKIYDYDNLVVLCPKCHRYVDKHCINGTLDFTYNKVIRDYVL